MPRTQENRPIAVATPLGEEKVLIKSFSATEQMGRPFRIELEMLSEDGGIVATDILGQRVTLRVAQPDGGTRYFNGHVSRWYQTTPSGGMARYRATLVPWVWLLTRAANCRIFQELSIPDIVKTVFRDHGFSDFQDSLNGSYDPLDYCVQYRETDFNFVSRLLEQVGIYYFFKHEDGKHTMVLADSPSAHKVYGGYKEITYHPPDRVVAGREFITDWANEKRVQTGKFVHTDFDFTKPDTNLEARSQTTVTHAGSKFEVFDYPGDYATAGLGETFAKVRMEEMETEHETAQGETDSRGVTAGHKFTLKGFPREDQNAEWLVTSTTIHAESDSYEGGGASSGNAIYRASFTAIKAATQFRAARVTPKPLISGPQTAIVTGKAGEEIWTDKHGRVKVQFHWDRNASADEKASCWLRVAQSWAGKKYGAMFIPRVGHEVIVEFLEGDPDRPIVTGCVYNAREAPAYTLPDHMTRSGVKTNSSKGGGGFNEIRFEDKKGEEQVFIHGEKQLDVRIKKDALTWIGKDRHDIVVENEFVEIQKNRNVKVKENSRLEVVKNRSVTVGGTNAMKVGGKNTLQVTGDMVEVFKANHSEDVTGKYFLKATGGLVIECPAGVTIKCGGSHVVVDATGVTLKGGVVTLDGGMTNINSGPGSPAASGSAGSADDPEAPEQPLEAAMADPGENSAVQSRNAEIVAQQTQTATSGTMTPPGEEGEDAKTWYEFQVLDAEGVPKKDEPVRITMTDGQQMTRRTDSNGVVRIEDVDASQVARAELTEREDDEWKDLGAGERRNAPPASPPPSGEETETA